jgi:large subunit ribosomal protein L25
MEVGKLTVNRRYKTGKGVARSLRRQGLVPGICYGATVEEPIWITVDPKALKGSLDPLKRRNTVIDITVEDEAGGKVEIVAMLRDYQIHPIKRNVTHVDLVAIDTNKPVEALVPVELTGKSVGVVEGGQIHFERHAIEVWCTPANIPAKIELDISALDVGDVLHVYDLDIPENVEIHTPPHLSVVSCVAPTIEVVETVEGEEGVEGEEAPADGEAKADDDEGGDKDKK